MASVTLAMIVKNESKILRKSLDSYKPYVDKFEIFDTGSTDDTQKIIKEYGELHEIPFTNFVDTKNEALRLSTGDFIVFSDADEVLIQGGELFREWANTEGTSCVNGLIVEGLVDGVPSNEYVRARLFRNDGSWEYVGPGVHEILLPTKTGSGKNVTDHRIKIVHDHSHRSPESYKIRFLGYVNILKEYLEKYLDDPRANFYLARTYKDLGEWLFAIEYYRKYRTLNSGFRDEIWQSCYDEAQSWKVQGEYDQSLRACDIAEQIDPRRAEISVLRGQIYFELQNIDESVAHFEKAASLPVPQDVLLFMNPRMHKEIPNDYLVQLYDKKHDYRKAYSLAKGLADGLSKPDGRITHNLNWLIKQKDKTIFFALGNTPESVIGNMLEYQGAGGTETAYLEISNELAKRGHNVFVFSKCPEEHKHGETYFVPFEKLNEYVDLKPDVIVTSRWFEPLLTFENSKKVIWTHDAHFTSPSVPDAYQKADGVVCSSRWHRNYIAERFGQSVSASKIHIIPLSIRKELFENKNIERDPLRVVYSSNPDRGLFILENMWQEISERIQGINLRIFYGWEGLRTWSNEPSWLEKIESDKNRIEKWAKDSGNIVLTGRLTKKQLAEEMLCATSILYPNNFWESLCITAIESQMAGIPMITTAIGALNTTLNQKSNILIDKNPFSKEYEREFIEETVKLMKDRKRLEKYSQKCISFAKDWPTWESIAEQWENIFYSF